MFRRCPFLIFLIGLDLISCQLHPAWEDDSSYQLVSLPGGSQNPYRFTPVAPQNAVSKGGIAFIFKSSGSDHVKPIEIARIEFADRTDRIVIFQDSSRVCARFDQGENRFFDCNLPSWNLNNRSTHFFVMWNFNASEPSQFLSLSIDGQRYGTYYSANDVKTSTLPPAPTDLRGRAIEFPAPPRIEANSATHEISAIRWFNSAPSYREMDLHLRKFCGAIADIHIPISDFQHFIGKQVSARETDGETEAWTIDSVIASSPEIELLPGTYQLTISASCRMESSPECSIAEVACRALSGATWFRSDIRRNEFIDPQKFHQVERAFEINAPTRARIDVRMLRFGYQDFLLDYIAIEGPVQHDWPAISLERTLGKEHIDSSARSGKVITNAHALAFGPYRRLDRIGWYTAAHRVKISSTVHCNTVGTLDVYAHDGSLEGKRGNKSYGTVGLSNQHADDAYHIYTIPFFYDGAELMEFRTLVYTVIPNGVTFAGVDIHYAGADEPNVIPVSP